MESELCKIPDPMLQAAREMLSEVEMFIPELVAMPRRIDVNDTERFPESETIVRVRYGEPWSVQVSSVFSNTTGKRTRELMILNRK